MSISFSTALSALSAFSTAISVTGNNLSNLNTIGFKTSQVSFHDLVTQSITATEYVGRNHLVRFERPGAPCYIVKQPRDANTPDAATMWTEAAVFWLSVHDPVFAVLAPWMAKYYHYDEPNKILTIELITAASSLM